MRRCPSMSTATRATSHQTRALPSHPCRSCGAEIPHRLGKGRQRQWCDTCRAQREKRRNEPRTCPCGVEIEQPWFPGRGGPRRRCDSCRARRSPRGTARRWHAAWCTCSIERDRAPAINTSRIRGRWAGQMQVIDTAGWRCVHCGKGTYRDGRCNACGAFVVMPAHVPITRIAQ